MSSDDTPPDGGNASRPMRQALSAQLRRHAEDEQGHSGETLELIVRQLTMRALRGDIPAIKEIFDRMDGKSAAGTMEEEGPRRVIVRWKD
jgi:hypothetical protein